MINPPASNKYQYWTNDKTSGGPLDRWLKDAAEHKGSWWPDWRAWLATLDTEEVPARSVGTGPLPAIEEAPGSYVRVKA